MPWTQYSVNINHFVQRYIVQTYIHTGIYNVHKGSTRTTKGVSTKQKSTKCSTTRYTIFCWPASWL